MAKSSSSFKPGESGNPGGRPKVVAEVRELARQHTAAAIQTLASIMRTTTLDWEECLAGVAVACCPVAVLELVKVFRARRARLGLVKFEER